MYNFVHLENKMKKKQTSIQDLLLQEDQSKFNLNSIPKIQESNMNELSFETEDPNLSVVPPKIFFFKSMNEKNQNSNQAEINDFRNNNNEANIITQCIDSPVNPNPPEDTKTLLINNSPNNFEITLPINSHPQSYLVPVPTSTPKHNTQKNPTIMPQINGAIKVPEKYKTSPSISRIRWTKQEDEQLMGLVRKWGARKWNEIAASLGTKTAKQCRDHYANCLDPEIKNSLWTVEEEQILLLKYEQLGPHWSRIKSFLPVRSTSIIKNYITMLLKKNGKEIPTNAQANKEKLEPNVSSGNSCSENDEHDNYYINSKEMQEHKDGFAIHDINFLLNRPAKFTGTV